MIRIHRGEVPRKLIKSGQEELESMLKLYEEGVEEYNTGQIEFCFKRSIYSSDMVRECLKQAQHKKCCYTEAFLEDTSHIEHFRPKTSIRDGQGSPRQYPGYYWLAYKWENLLMCNTKVNSSKNDLFPLHVPLDRARSIDEPLEKESPVLVDPVNENPRNHIRFSRDAPFGISDRGKMTIDLLNLRAPYLREKRMRKLRHLDSLLSIKKLDSLLNIKKLDSLLNIKKLVLHNTANATDVADIENSLKDNELSLKEAVKPTAEFSSMAMDLLTQDLN